MFEEDDEVLRDEDSGSERNQKGRMIHVDRIPKTALVWLDPDTTNDMDLGLRPTRHKRARNSAGRERYDGQHFCASAR